MKQKFSVLSVMVCLTPIFMMGIYYFRHLPPMQLQLITVAAMSYLTLALIHHLHDKTLKMDLLIEYVLIAILVLVILQSAGGLLL